MSKEKLDNMLKKFLCELTDGEIMIADGLSYAFIGVTTVNGNVVAVYSTHLIVNEIMKEDCMDIETAEEYVKFNIKIGRAHV